MPEEVRLLVNSSLKSELEKALPPFLALTELGVDAGARSR
jgi:hypothetical protein